MKNPATSDAGTAAERVAAIAAAGGELLELRDAGGDRDLHKRLGEACRRSPDRLLVWQVDSPGAQPIPVTLFYAFGFRRLFDCVEGDCHHVLYEYVLSQYKTPPDWLNARFWAHPERFGLDPAESQVASRRRDVDSD